MFCLLATDTEEAYERGDFKESVLLTTQTQKKTFELQNALRGRAKKGKQMVFGI